MNPKKKYLEKPFSLLHILHHRFQQSLPYGPAISWHPNQSTSQSPCPIGILIAFSILLLAPIYPTYMDLCRRIFPTLSIKSVPHGSSLWLLFPCQKTWANQKKTVLLQPCHQQALLQLGFQHHSRKGGWGGDNQRAATTIHTRCTASQTAALAPLLTPTQKFQLTVTVLPPWLAKRKLLKGRENIRQCQEKQEVGEGRTKFYWDFSSFTTIPRYTPILPSPVTVCPPVGILLWRSVCAWQHQCWSV